MANMQKSGEAAAIATMMSFSALLSVLIEKGLVSHTEFEEAMARLVTWTNPATELGSGVRAYVHIFEEMIDDLIVREKEPRGVREKEPRGRRRSRWWRRAWRKLLGG